jgi:hypothetical protein
MDLHTLFSQLDPCSTFEFALPLSSAVLAALNDGIAERWHWSFMESELLSKSMLVGMATSAPPSMSLSVGTTSTAAPSQSIFLAGFLVLQAA